MQRIQRLNNASPRHTGLEDGQETCSYLLGDIELIPIELQAIQVYDGYDGMIGAKGIENGDG